MEHPTFCPHCGAETIGTMQFCTSCGKRVTVAASAELMKPAKKRLSPAAFAGIVIGAIVLSCVFLSVTGLGLKLLQMAPVLPIEGQEGRITAGGPVAIVAVDTTTYDEQIADAQSNGTGRTQERLTQGRIFLVPDGTRVLILAVDRQRYQLRVLEGEHAGKSGFVPLTFVKK